MIIRGETVTERATLTSSGELRVASMHEGPPSFVEEECARAFQKGEESGEKRGYEMALAETTSLLKLLQTLTRKLLDHKQRLLDQLKPEMVEFAMSVCERVIRKELSQPEAFVKLINSLLSYATSQVRSDSVQLILATDDLAMLENHLHAIQYDKREINGVAFRADPLMKRGDCRIETPTGLLHYTIGRELADLQSKVLQG